jgi:hypothetical protein
MEWEVTSAIQGGQLKPTYFPLWTRMRKGRRTEGRKKRKEGGREGGRE